MSEQQGVPSPKVAKFLSWLFGTTDSCQAWLEDRGTYLGCYLMMLWAVVGWLIRMHDANHACELFVGGWTVMRLRWSQQKSKVAKENGKKQENGN